MGARRWYICPKTYLSDADDHVADVGFERVDRAGLLGATEPDADADIGAGPLLAILLHLFELTSDVGEILRDCASDTLDRNFPCLHCARNCNNTEEQQDD